MERFASLGVAAFVALSVTPITMPRDPSGPSRHRFSTLA
jgi:hypothetical protein